MKVDLCVIGAGPAGFAAAMRACDLGKRVVLVERGRVGGAGLHEGALSSKTMWHLSNDYAGACRTDRGFRAEGLTLSYGAVMDTVRAAVAERRTILERAIAGLAPQLRLVRGAARFVSPHAVEVIGPDVRELVSADFFLVATGSRPRVPPGLDVDGERIVTSDHLESLPDFPASLAVIGAGVVGCEYTTLFGNFGKTRLHLLDRQPRILPFEDDDVAAVVADNYRRMGIRIHGASRLEEARVRDDGVRLTIAGPGGVEQVDVERALVSVGRVPATADLGLTEIGVDLRPDGGVAVADTRSSLPHVYAAGDTTMDLALVNVAEMEGRFAVEHMFGLAPRPIRYEALSAILFLSPEVASVGLNEQQAKAAGVPYRVARMSNRLNHRNVAMRSTRGFIKLLAGEDDRLLGLRVVGPQASSCIQGVALLIDRGGTLDDLDRCVHPHPAVTEGVQECARALLGRSLHKPTVFDPDELYVEAAWPKSS